MADETTGGTVYLTVGFKVGLPDVGFWVGWAVVGTEVSATIVVVAEAVLVVPYTVLDVDDPTPLELPNCSKLNETQLS